MYGQYLLDQLVNTVLPKHRHLTPPMPPYLCVWRPDDYLKTRYEPVCQRKDDVREPAVGYKILPFQLAY